MPPRHGRPTGSSGYGSSTVDKAIDILEAIATSAAGMASTAIAETLELDRSTTHRLLTTLERRGLIQRAAPRRYAAGPALTSLALGSGLDPRVAVEPVLHDLVQLTGESASFSILHGEHFYCVANQLSSHELSYCPATGHNYPLHSGAAGLTLWAFQPDDRRQQLLDNVALTAFTTSTITDRDALRCELDATVERGYGRSAGVRTPGGCSIACPVSGSQGVVVGALALSSAEVRVPLSKLEEYAPDLRVAAENFAHTMGGQL